MTENLEIALSILLSTVLLVSVVSAASNISRCSPIRANKSAAWVRCFGVPSVRIFVKCCVTDCAGKIAIVGSAAARTVFKELVAKATNISAKSV